MPQAEITHIPTTNFTPTPPEGFPHIHINSDTHILDQLHPTTRRIWSETPQPKLIARIFGTQNPHTRWSHHSLATLTSAAISNACEGLLDPTNPLRIHQQTTGTSPCTLLISNLPPDAARFLLNGQVWSSPAVTIEVRDFYLPLPPPFLISLQTPSKTSTAKALLAIRDFWFHSSVEADISSILSRDSTNALTELRATLQMERLPDNSRTQTPYSLLTITARSSTTPKTWSALKKYLQSLDYFTNSNGLALFTLQNPICHICNSVAHESLFCPFPGVPLWNRPTLQLHNTTSTLTLADLENEEAIKADEEAELQILAQNESIYG